jgi:hypothetical protein
MMRDARWPQATFGGQDGKDWAKIRCRPPLGLLGWAEILGPALLIFIVGLLLIRLAASFVAWCCAPFVKLWHKSKARSGQV